MYEMNRYMHSFQEMKTISWRKVTVPQGKFIFHQIVPEISVFFSSKFSFKIFTKELLKNFDKHSASTPELDISFNRHARL